MYWIDDLKGKVLSLVTALYYAFWRFFILLSAYVFICLPFQFLVTSYGASSGFIKVSFLPLLFFSILIGIAYLVRKREYRTAKWMRMPSFLFLFALFLRLGIIYLIGRGTTQISDFMTAFQSAQKAIPIHMDHYAIFSSWGMYVFYLKVLFKLFGASELTGVIANAFLEAGSVTLIYFLVMLTLRDKYAHIVAVTSAILYAVWPSQLVYLVLLSPEFVHIFLLLLGLVLLALTKKKINHVSSVLGVSGYALSAFCISLSGFFKSTDKIMIIALIISMFFVYLDSQSLTREKCVKKITIIPFRLVGITVFLTSYLIANALGFMFLDYFVGRTVNRDPSPHYINIGLSSDSRGVWNPEVSGEYGKAVVESGFDYDKAGKIIMDSLKKDIDQNKHITTQFFIKKLTDAWQGMDYLYFSQETIKPEKRIYIQRSESAIFIQSYYLMTGILVFLGCRFILKEKINQIFFLSALFIVGFMLLMLFLENQPRYKVVSYPYICILAGSGIRYLIARFEG
ncbi:hypothetical protein [Lacrimispora defluvii]|uniref:Dolichyl-phosphate-mannose-protein mannosyltransferase n=1 Tax=Lacrimispora defluvii TaxID=2719233 RepID=A0ABX1VZG6_9FIRM|nr:hypothetical protein [Lacrimispora defluvii]NNJ32825.1 hypothetical protein [Lacrimispora defluvii]